jgi:hypothetical protein
VVGNPKTNLWQTSLFSLRWETRAGMKACSESSLGAEVCGDLLRIPAGVIISNSCSVLSNRLEDGYFLLIVMTLHSDVKEADCIGTTTCSPHSCNTTGATQLDSDLRRTRWLSLHRPRPIRIIHYGTLRSQCPHIMPQSSAIPKIVPKQHGLYLFSGQQWPLVNRRIPVHFAEAFHGICRTSPLISS